MKYHEENVHDSMENSAIKMPIADAVQGKHGDEVNNTLPPRTNATCAFITDIILNQTDGVPDHNTCYLWIKFAAVPLLLLKNMDRLVMIHGSSQLVFHNTEGKEMAIINTVLVGLALSLNALV